jgi:ppGpp synthetase/RelA/SpoT-type nucleotidyltranferase
MTEWIDKQVELYQRRQRRYEKYAEFLEGALRDATIRLAPLAIVQARPKSIASFAEKALRKRSEHENPVDEFTDLCGARVIARTHEELAPLVAWLTSTFEIDWANSDDTVERLEADEFGYRSLHYIVSIDPIRAVELNAPKSIAGLKAEVQLRTMLGHAWADVTHDLVYKGGFSLPREWQREIAMAAAGLEEIDHSFSRIERGLKLYATSYGRHFGSEELVEESRILETVLAHDPENVVLAWRAGKLAMIAGDWARAVALMESHVDESQPAAAYQPLLRDLGISLCKREEPRRGSRAFRRGQHFLDIASSEPYRDPDALAALGGTWKGVDSEKALECYRRAFEIDPADYYALLNYIECELDIRPHASVVRPFTPLIDRAIERCLLHIEVGVNLPWAWFSLGELRLLRRRPYEAAIAYARGVASTPSSWTIDVALESIDRLSNPTLELEGRTWAESILLLGAAARFPEASKLQRLRELATPKATMLKSPVVILAGATASPPKHSLDGYVELLRDVFRGFSGTIVSGGTRGGVAAIAGELGVRSPKSIRTVGYVPREIPRRIRIDDRYVEIRRTPGAEFSLAEPLRYWADILYSGVSASDVTLLAAGGGLITTAEAELATALGARAAVIALPGQWPAEPVAGGPSILPMDLETVRAFLVPADPLPAELRDDLGHAVHESYIGSRREWQASREVFRESSRRQADHIPAKIARIGCEMRRSTSLHPTFQFTEVEIEELAEMEHGRWNAERASGGWRYGAESNVDSRVTPFLVPWSELDGEVKNRDRRAVREIPRMLASVGYEIVRREN